MKKVVKDILKSEFEEDARRTLLHVGVEHKLAVNGAEQLRGTFERYLNKILQLANEELRAL